MTASTSQKLFIAAIILVSLISVQSQTQDFIYQKSDQNCQTNTQATSKSQKTSLSGWWWSGQTCLQCIDATCHDCNTWWSCNAKCNPGFSSYNIPPNKQQCRACNNNPTGMELGVNTCTWLNVQYVAGQQFYPYDWQALSCLPNYQLFGGFCASQPNCITYGQYGLCVACQQGYYVSTQGNCASCNNNAWTGVQSPSIGTLTYGQCVQCYGPKQCQTCGIWWDTTNPASSNSYGSYLATNSQRSQYDTNIAMDASYCRACNPGCTCSGPSSLCDACVVTDGTWYKDPVQNQCFRCNNVCNQDETSLPVWQRRINCCSQCIYDTFLQLPRCTLCQTQFNSQLSPATQITDVQYIGSVNSISDTYWPSSGAFSQCFRCDRQAKKFLLNGGTSETDFDIYSANALQLINLKDLDELADNVTGNANYNSLYWLQNYVPGDTACTTCTVQSLPNYNISTDNGNTWQQGSQSRFTLNIVTCTQCQNGYEILTLKTSPTNITYGFAANVNNYNGSTSGGQVKIRWPIAPMLQQCRSCQSLIQNQDKWVQGFSAGGFWTTRFQYARRCSAISTNKYEISQCGATKASATSASNSFTGTGTYADYVSDPSTISGEGKTRGPIVNSAGLSGNPTNSTWQASVSAALGGATNVYLVQADMNNGSPVPYLCIPNVQNCRTITQSLNYTAFSSDNTAFTCDSCFDQYPFNYNLTSNRHCRPCATSTNLNLLGCAQCQADTVANDNLICTVCSNGAMTYIGTPAINFQYYLDGSTPKQCRPCGQGCSTCVAATNGTSQPKCNQCMWNWGFTDNTQTQCAQCSIYACASCDFNQTVCTQCLPGYTMVQTINNTSVCNKCDQWCLTCTGGRKTCTQCSNPQWYYLSNGVCRPKTTGCITHDPNTGFCQLCQYGYTLRSNYCYACFGAATGYIDCASGGTNNQFNNNGTDVRKANQWTTSRILTLLDEVEDSF